MSRPAREVEFFRVWTSGMAYVLGLWWADGCMRIKANTGAHEIEIASNDKDHLEAITEIIDCHYQFRRVTQVSNTWVLNFCSKQMYQDLEALGGTPRKSKTIGFPPVPDQFLAHFVRGVIDGDGTLGWNGDRPIVQIYSGSQRFLAALAQKVESMTGIPAPNIATNRSNWYLKWSTIRAKCLVAWLYVTHYGPSLPRKAIIAEKILEWQPKKKPEQGSVTEAMRAKFPFYLPE